MAHFTGKATKIYSLQGNTFIFINKNLSTTILFSWLLSTRDTVEKTKLSNHTNKIHNCKQS